MDSVSVKIQKLNDGAVVPEYAHGNGEDAGFDLTSVENVRLMPGLPVAVGTGLAFQIPVGYEMQIRSRSGLALKGVVVANSPGTIDPGYRGEVKAILVNVGRNPVEITSGQRVCQAVIARTVSAQFKVEEALDESERGEGGFGSTGE